MLATGACVTVTVALPVFPSLVAMMFAVPTATAVTTPAEDTVATVVLSELHVTARPVSVAPFASSVVAVACEVPTAVIELGTRATVTDATGTGVTVMAEVPLLPSLVAVIVADPAVCDVTSPVASTDATEGSVDVQATARPVKMLSPASFATAESCCVEPATSVAVDGLTDTLATGTGVRTA
jgi:hypothetical protein